MERTAGRVTFIYDEANGSLTVRDDAGRETATIVSTSPGVSANDILYMYDEAEALAALDEAEAFANKMQEGR